MPQSVEGKMVARIRNLIKDDTDVKAIIGDRVYDSHISTIYQPEYPAISITLLDSSPLEYLVPAIGALFQIDLWVKEYDANRGNVKQDLYNLMSEVRRVLHLPQANYDATTLLTLMEMREEAGGAVLFETDSNLWHMAKRYSVRGL